MANFEKAKLKTLRYEGGFSNDPDDKGGRTYKGISEKNWPMWAGWFVINVYIKNTPESFPAILEKDSHLDELVSEFYITNFWNKVGGQSLINDHLAEEIFDTAVNNGVNTAIKLVQSALGVPETGKLDWNTIKQLNQLS